jgi:23S rRNA (uracil1939-C5)-methyltransferase
VAHVGRVSTAIAAPRILDLFCGVGLMSMSMGDKSIHISGADTNRMAIESAKINASLMDFRSAKYTVSSVERYIQAAEIRADSLVLINPPRSGCTTAVIKGIASQKPIHIISISCSLKTHVLDLAVWKQNGYAVLSLKAYDMFPFTDFLETVTVLKRKT